MTTSSSAATAADVRKIQIPPPFDTTQPPPQLLAQGAEGMLFKSFFLGTGVGASVGSGSGSGLNSSQPSAPSIPCAIKYRLAKRWRHPVLDVRLTRHRILAEARMLARCRREGISVPALLALDWEGSLARNDEEGRGREDLGEREGGIGAVGEVTTEDDKAAATEKSKKGRRAGSWMMVEWIEGLTVRAALNTWLPKHVSLKTEPKIKDSDRSEVAATRQPELVDLMHRIGREIGRLHQIGVVHGDLTTSNLMLRHKSKEKQKPQSTGEESNCTERHNDSNGDAHVAELTIPSQAPLDGDVVLIDFGLASQVIQDEDRAVDLYVLERAFGSTHPNTEDLFDELLNAYGSSFKGGRAVLKKLEGVRQRGRKKSMIG